MQEIYNYKDIEKKQQLYWTTNKIFEVKEDSKKPKYYCLSMFAYPSGKLHMGHVRNYTISDVIARFYTLNGYNVLQPMGWDAFGLPAENAALQSKNAPAAWTYQNIAHMKQQLQNLGLAIDWSREIATCDPNYYRWQQWLFIQLFKKGIIYRKNGIVNWDPIDQTVLANEQVIDGKGWRSGAVVEKKQVPMYYFKITNYAEELLQGLDGLDGWPEQVKTMQRNWIGKSKGMEISFPCTVNDIPLLTVFTTRPDTLFGVTYIAIAADHPIAQFAHTQNAGLTTFINECKHGGTSEAELATQEKKGIFSGLYVSHPITNKPIPVWIANYVISGYGTGAVMGVPAHCQRDFEFAKQYNLPIEIVVKEYNQENILTANDLPHAIAEDINEQNIIINSQELSGLNYTQAFQKLEQMLVDKNLGQVKTNFRLRDWGISRQRYWGCPIPIIHCANCGDVTAPENHLPILLPQNIISDGTGSPLAKMPDFLNTTCPNCGGTATRETDTMDTFVDSSWYYARYASYDCQNAILDERINYWEPVDQYIGGVEHAILHLLYARFFHKCLRDLGLVKSNEPFTNLLTQGMVIADTFYRVDANGRKEWFNPADVRLDKDNKGQITRATYKGDGKEVSIGGNEKMSKSKNNGIDPQKIIDKYGADTARLFMMFAAPCDLSLEWSDHGIEGSNRFIRKLWRIVSEHVNQGIIAKYTSGDLTPEQKKLRTGLHQTIVKVTNDIQVRKQFNTAIASIMELLNAFAKVSFNTSNGRHLVQEILEATIIMLYPIIPHCTNAMWNELCPNKNIIDHGWIKPDLAALETEQAEIILQVNGKLRGKMTIRKGLEKQEIEKLALQNSNVQKFIRETTIKKVIVVLNKLVNIVI